MSPRDSLLFAISLLVLVLAIPTECYAKSSTILGSKYNIGEWEVRTQAQLAVYIYQCSLSSDYTTYIWYGIPTNSDTIYSAANGVGYLQSISFYIGHGNEENTTHYFPFWPFSHQHSQHYVVADDGSHVYDCDIDQVTNSRFVQFVFLWSCLQGNEIGSMITYPCGEVKAHGMPLAWLNTTSLSGDGYNNPDGNGYAFVGFKGSAPVLLFEIGSNFHAGYYFASYFYERAMRRHYSINDALDYAARSTWDPQNQSYKFSDSPFYKGFNASGEGKMVVYGDGNLEKGSASSTPPVSPPPPRYVGCPYVSAWDGSQYMLDNNLLPKAGASNGADVEDYYMLEQSLVRQNGKYSLLLSEFEQEHSYFDQVKLMAVDHDSDISIAVTQNGEVLTYKNPVAPVSAVDNYENNRLSEVNVIDGDVSDPSTFFDGQTGDSLMLNFGQFNSENAKLILKDDRKCEHDECCIEVQVGDGSGRWQTVEVLAPRAYWATQAVDLTPYAVRAQELWVRLYWTSPHRLDFVGLDTTKQDDYEIHYVNLISATHSTQGDVKTELLQSDNIYAELIPSQQIQLEFTLPNNSREARTFILYIEGHYHTIL